MREAFVELRRLENIALQRMELDSVASENHPDQRARPEREQPEDSRLSTRRSPPNGPRILNDGPELLRSNHC
jgi:hypothetical protein